MTYATRSSKNRQIFLYFGLLTLLCSFASPEVLLDVPTAFILKNHLHATVGQVSMFRLLTGIPLYVCFIFGLVRDQWDPFGWRDPGYFRLFAPLTMGVLVWMALFPLGYRGLLVGMIITSISHRFISAAFNGLMALIGQEDFMSGRLSSLSLVLAAAPTVAVFFVSGYISERLSPRQIFFLAAGFILLILPFGFWKPRSVFNDAYEDPLARRTDFLGDVRRLVRHRAIYPAILLNFLWNFTPGPGTPLQFYLTDHLHARDAVFGYFQAVTSAGFIPAYLLYGFLCTRFAPNKLLWCATILAVPQWVPMVFVHSGNPATIMLIGAAAGLMGGMATAAYTDLAIRSCPAGLQGTLMMLVGSVWQLSGRGGDLVGSKIYSMSPDHGFLYCVIALTIVYASMLFVIPLIPEQLIATADGEANPTVETEALAEIGMPKASTT
jgi:hypothetical protein